MCKTPAAPVQDRSSGLNGRESVTPVGFGGSVMSWLRVPLLELGNLSSNASSCCQRRDLGQVIHSPPLSARAQVKWGEQYSSRDKTSVRVTGGAA